MHASIQSRTWSGVSVLNTWQCWRCSGDLVSLARNAMSRADGSHVAYEMRRIEYELVI